ncbi:subtilisin-like protein [Coprinopsis marcescibilis]|uniref:Subtilisin-like protein n=1 Tax=Coprinopsis marcescibilis TaxID=230819 RepID=A0A5C3KGB8_COPMA|nr:subtilisin-like protein [Coprinopsis marcescibilis]
MPASDIWKPMDSRLLDCWDCLITLVLYFLDVRTTFAAFPILPLRRSLDDHIILNKFIFEVESEANTPNERFLTRDLDVVYSRLRARQVSFEIIEQFDEPDFFVGASVIIHIRLFCTLNKYSTYCANCVEQSADDVAILENLPGIKAIYPVRRYEQPSTVMGHSLNVRGLGANDPKIISIGEAPHILTGVDKVHARGHFGKGIKIGIIDTGRPTPLLCKGVAYYHPSLGGGFGPGHKVEVGFDFVGDDFDGPNTPYPDNDPLDICNGHGTHVAGIVGTDPGNELNITGVAHEATLGAYRVFGCNKFGYTQDDMSMDGPIPLSRLSPVGLQKVAKSKPLIIVDCQGSIGCWFAASPSSGINVISVGGVENFSSSVFPLRTAKLQGTDQLSVIYFSFIPLPIAGEWPIYVTSNDTTIIDDACDPLPEDTPDLSYDRNGLSSVTLGNYTVALIDARDGQHLVDRYLAGDDIGLLPSSRRCTLPQHIGWIGGHFFYVSFFLRLLDSPLNFPIYSAPVSHIVAPYPRQLGSWEVMSGTSTASAYAADAAALYLAMKGKRYKLSHTAAGTALTIQADSNSPELGPVPLSDAAARVTIVPSEFTLAAGCTREVVVSVKPPAGVVASRFSVYSGFIHISSPGENHRVTYLGLAAFLKDKRVLDDYDEWSKKRCPLLWLPPPERFKPDQQTTHLSMVTSRFSSSVYIPLKDQTRLLFISWGRWNTRGVYLCDTQHCVFKDMYDSYYTFSVNGPFFSNGTVIPAGLYRILLRALRVTGNPERQEDYESWLSPVIGVPLV